MRHHGNNPESLLTTYHSHCFGTLRQHSPRRFRFRIRIDGERKGMVGRARRQAGGFEETLTLVGGEIRAFGGVDKLEIKVQGNHFECRSARKAGLPVEPELLWHTSHPSGGGISC